MLTETLKFRKNISARNSAKYEIRTEELYSADDDEKN